MNEGYKGDISNTASFSNAVIIVGSLKRASSDDDGRETQHQYLYIYIFVIPGILGAFSHADCVRLSPTGLTTPKQ